MKATELMIGDWVNVIHNSKSCNVKVIFLDDMQIAYDERELIVKTEKAFKPIPLTTEIMEKNGYGKLTNGSYALRDIEKRIDITIWRSGGEPTSTMEITKNEYTEKEVTYLLPEPYSVHELQHALRLCGLNDLADNFKI